MEHPRHHHTLRYFAKNISIVVALVIIWRGIWYMLDAIDFWLFGGHHFWTGALGLVLGILMLYLPDHDLKEIEKL